MTIRTAFLRHTICARSARRYADTYSGYESTFSTVDPEHILSVDSHVYKVYAHTHATRVDNMQGI